jgi:hypothetical protein
MTKLVVGAAIVFVVAFFFAPLVPSTVTTNEDLACELQGLPCALTYPTSTVTYYLYTSPSYASFGVGIVYSPDNGGGLWFIV